METRQDVEARKTRTITLTDRHPVKIYDDEWPVIASADGDSYGDHDHARHQQASAQGELDKYLLRVRRHADGSTIIYGILDAATAWTRSEDVRGGELLDDGADIARAIRRVGEYCGLPARVIRECIASLPPVEL